MISHDLAAKSLAFPVSIVIKLNNLAFGVFKKHCLHLPGILPRPCKMIILADYRILGGLRLFFMVIVRF